MRHILFPFLRLSMLVLALSLFNYANTFAQVVIYQQNFDGNNGTFSNGIVSEVTPINGWLASSTLAQNGAFRHIWNFSTQGTGNWAPISGRSLGVGIYNGNNPFYAGSPFRYYNGTTCGFFAPTFRWAYVPIPTTGYTNITVEFQWRSTGEVFSGEVWDFGTVMTSIDGGGTWLMDQTQGLSGTDGNSGTFFSGGLYYNSSGVTTTTITLPASRDDQANFALAFRHVNDGCYGTGGSFIIDNIVVRGIPTSSCVAGTASPAFQYVPTNGTANMTLTGYSGSTIQWQVSPNGTSGWTNVSGGSGATTDSYTTGSLANGTYYYRAVVTDGGSCTDNSNVIEVSVAASPTYCNGAGSGNAFLNNHIESILFHEWTDPNPGYYTNNYLNYSDTATYGYATVVPDQYHHFAATIRANGTGTASTTVAAWIDFNRDGVFDNTPITSGGELLDIQNFSSTVGNTYAAYFTVPATASGDMRMRLRALRGNFGSIDPCGVYTNSQTKDFTVFALPAITGGQVCGTVNGSGDVVNANSTLDKVYISRVHVYNSGGTLIDNTGQFFGVQVGSNVTMYNYSNMMGSFSNGLTFEAGQTYTIDVEHSGYTTATGVFIDWNGDGDFLDTDELIGRTTSSTANPYTFTFTVPSTITDGIEVAMRVRLYYDNLGNLGNAITACGNISDGFQQYSEVEDYRALLSVPPLVCAPVSNLTAAIGDPANGVAHHMDVSWDHLTGALSYDLEYSNDGSSWTSLGSVSGTTYDHNFGDNPNVPMYYRVRATDGSQTCAWATMATPVYTAVDVPAPPTTSNVAANSMDLDIVAETPVANPAITTYAIFETTTGQYVQANGTLGATAVFQTKATWGTVSVTGLNSGTEYCYVLTARNADGDERGGAGAVINSVQPFNVSGDLNTTAGSGPTNVWWSPSSCTTGGMVWNGANGCPGGAVGFSGSFNNFYGCFLRSPALNCGTLNTVVMTFDLSNSYFASQPNDRVYFNMWAPTASSPGGTYISAATVNGSAGSDLFFDQVRNCEEVVVEFDLSTVTDKSAILFYINADCAYNNSNVFSVWSDNIRFNEPATTTCATTLSVLPDLVVQSITPATGTLCGSGTIDYDVVIENQGSVAITNGTSFDVAAYVGSLACGGTAVSTQTFSAGLAPSGTTTLTFSLPLSGSSDVSFEVDAGAAITEQDETNNCTGDNSVAISSGLGGTYTIDAGQATGGTNFASFSDAASALNANGVCAAVIFNVATDTYNESFTLTDVAGVSNVNTITYQSASGNPLNVQVTSTAFSDVVTLHGTSYVTFKDITFVYNGTSTYSVFEIQDNSDNVTLTNCVLTSNTTSTSTSFTNSVVYVSESSSALDIDSLVIENCTIDGAAYALYFASSSTESTGIIIRDNVIDNNIAKGIYLDDCKGPIVSGNTINSQSNANSSYTAIEIDNGSEAYITKNQISSDYMRYGILYDNSDASSSTPGLIANNFVALGGSFSQSQGIRINGSDYVDVYFNSVHNYSSSNTALTSAFYFGGTITDGTINIANNIFAMTGGGSAQACFYAGSSGNLPDVNVMDYNNYYYTGSSYAANFGGTRATLAALQAYTSKDANSLEIDPQFASNTDLHVSASALQNAGTGIAGITDDIDGDTRQPSPTIGADEFAVATVPNDASVTDLTSPTIPPCPGSNTFEVEVTNFGTSTLTSVTVEWSINGTPQSPVNVTGLNVATGNSTTVSLGSVSLNSNTAYNFVFNTTSPNGLADGNNANDTLTESNVFTSLVGTYTIGGTTPDFASWDAAVDALHAYGVCGAVVMNVREGTYNEQIQINAIAGVSAVNTVTFQADPANTNPAVLQYNAQSFSDNYVLGIYGSSYLRFNNLTINTTNTGTYRTVVDFLQANFDIQFTNNIIEAPAASSNSLNYALINSDGTAGNDDHYILFDGNTITNGSYGIFMDGSSSTYERGITIINNDITGFHAYGIRLDYQDTITVENNTIRNGVATAAATGIELSFADGVISIQKNIIECSGSSNTKTGIDTGPLYGTATDRAVIANNFIAVEGTSTTTGINLGSTTSYVDVLFNNVYTNGTNASSTRGLYTNGASNIRLYNNNFVAGGAGYAMYLLGSPLAASDYNNLYTNNTEFVYLSGNQADLATWQLSGFDANSVSLDPQYTSTTSPMDLHIAASALSGAGTAFGGITDDIDGDSRATPPTIGADEITSTGCGAVVTWTGSINRNWHVAGNWDCGQVPDRTKDVIIPGAPVNQPIIYDNGDAECKSLDLRQSSILTLEKLGELQIKIP